MLKLAQLTVAMNAFESSTKGMGKIGMDSVTISAFMEELEKIAISADVIARVGDKALKRGWSGARETKSLSRLMKAEGKAGKGAIMNPHAWEPKGYSPHGTTAISPQQTVAQRAKPSMQAQTVVQRGAPQTTPGTQTQMPARPSNLRRNLAMGGAVVGGMAAGHMMQQHQPQQSQMIH